MLSSPVVQRYAISDAPHYSSPTPVDNIDHIDEDQEEEGEEEEEEEEESLYTPALNLDPPPPPPPVQPPPSSTESQSHLPIFPNRPDQNPIPPTPESPASLIVHQLSRGHSFVSSFQGTSQYSSGGPSACGLASMNAASHVIAVHASGVRNARLLSVMHDRRFHEVCYLILIFLVPPRYLSIYCASRQALIYVVPLFYSVAWLS